MALIKYRRPFRSLIDRMFDEDFFNWPRISSDVVVDVYEKGKDIHMDFELPGLKKEDINIELSDNVLTVSGEAKKDEEIKEDDYYYRERRYGSFSRSFTIPEGIKEEDIKANFKNGILKLKFPKAGREEVKKRIEIE